MGKAPNLNSLREPWAQNNAHAKLYLLERPVLNPLRDKDVQMASSYRRPLFCTICRGRKLLLFIPFSLVWGFPSGFLPQWKMAALAGSCAGGSAAPALYSQDPSHAVAPPPQCLFPRATSSCKKGWEREYLDMLLLWIKLGLCKQEGN